MGISNGSEALSGLVRFIALIISSIVTFGEGAALSPYRRVIILKKSAAKEKKNSLLKYLFFSESPMLLRRLRCVIAIETIENYVAFNSPYTSIWPASK